VLREHLERLGIAVEAPHPHAADLYLACGCAAGRTDAIAAFDRELAPVVRSAAHGIDGSPDGADEVVQCTRERLLVAAPGAPPRIADYAGQGPLRAWVRIAAMRIALNLRRDGKRNLLVDDEAFFDLAAGGDAAARGPTSARYQDACNAALREAFAALTARERNLLRMHHLHGLTVDELAPTLGVHRATVARWIARAREQILVETRRRLQTQLGIGDATADSILRELSGSIDVSVSRLLAE